MTSTSPGEISHRLISGIRQLSVVDVGADIALSVVVAFEFDIVVDTAFEDTLVDLQTVAAVVTGN